jgi:hypothetical protein
MFYADWLSRAATHELSGAGSTGLLGVGLIVPLDELCLLDRQGDFDARFFELFASRAGPLPFLFG